MLLTRLLLVLVWCVVEIKTAYPIGWWKIGTLLRRGEHLSIMLAVINPYCLPHEVGCSNQYRSMDERRPTVPAGISGSDKVPS